MSVASRRPSRRGVLGFTFIELLVATTIIALLSAIGLVSFTSANRKARNGRRQADLEQVRSALELYRSDEGLYPATDGNWSDTVTEITPYLSSPGIADPKQGAAYYYSYDTSPPYSGSSCSSDRSYALCARLEPNQALYCVCSP